MSIRHFAGMVLVAALPCRAATAQHAPAEGAHKSANHAALYAGATMNATTDFTLGLEYVRRQPDARLGFGGYLDLVLFAHDAELLFGVTFNYFLRNFVLETGPGFVTSRGFEFLWRFGAGYELPMSNWLVTPKAYVDLIAGRTFVGLGLAVGKEF